VTLTTLTSIYRRQKHIIRQRVDQPSTEMKKCIGAGGKCKSKRTHQEGKRGEGGGRAGIALHILSLGTEWR
jgi:hypothetical protein